MSKRVLIVSPHFPPVNAPDMQRVRMSLPYFIESGWEVSVLTVADPTSIAPLEPELLEALPKGIEIKRAFCFSRRWTSWLGVNNVALRSLLFLFLRGNRLLTGRRYDVVYFSTTMFITLPLGRIWRFIHGVPYVIDLQDPWVTDYYERPGSPPPPGGWKYRIADRLGRILEGWTMRRAAHLITVSSAYVDVLRARYHQLRYTQSTELPFGSPDPDLQYVARRIPDRRLLPVGKGRLVFAGAIGPGMLSSVEILFAAIAEVRKNGLELSVHFFGTSYSPRSQSEPVTLNLAAQYGLQDCVYEQPARLRYFDALQVTLEADINLLLGSNDLAFTPSKIATVLAAGKSVLALAPAGSAMIQRLADLNQPCVTIPAQGSTNECVHFTAELLRELINSPKPAREVPAQNSLTARAVALEQLKIFDRVVAGNSAMQHNV